ESSAIMPGAAAIGCTTASQGLQARAATCPPSHPPQSVEYGPQPAASPNWSLDAPAQHQDPGYPPSMAAQPAGMSPLTLAQAEQIGRQGGRNMSGPGPSNAPASAQEMAYGASQHFEP